MDSEVLKEFKQLQKEVREANESMMKIVPDINNTIDMVQQINKKKSCKLAIAAMSVSCFLFGAIVMFGILLI